MLHELIEQANLVKPLMNPWAEMTIFAPSNNAFDDLAGADPVDVLATNPAALEAVLTLHIVDGAFTTADLYDGQVLETAAGADANNLREKVKEFLQASYNVDHATVEIRQA